MNTPVEAIRRYHAELKELRHDLHAHPELAFEENRTAGIVAERLAAWGVEVHRGLAKTGVVGVVKGRGTASGDRKSTRLNSSHQIISYAVFCLKKKKHITKIFPNPYTTGQLCHS